MKCLAICDPTRYTSQPLDVPYFYQQMARDSRVDFYHIPVANVFEAASNLPTIQVASVAGDLSYDDFVRLGDRANEMLSLADINLVFCRTLKPFPPDYLNHLSAWEPWTRFINRPSSKIDQIKADFLFHVAKDFIPDTVITSDWQEAASFFETHQIIVAKKGNSCGGRGVYKIWYEQHEFYVDNILSGTKTFSDFSRVMGYLQQDDRNESLSDKYHSGSKDEANRMLETESAGKKPELLQFCRYLNQVNAGDKRVVVVDGDIYGGYIRRSKSGHWVNNVSADGECIPADISVAEIEAIHQTVGHYQSLGLHTLGYDFLLDDDGTWRISEINAGNIGGFARLEILTGQPVMHRLISWMIEFAYRPLPVPLSPLSFPHTSWD